MVEKTMSDEEYQKYLKTVKPATIDDVSVNKNALTHKLLDVGRNNEHNYVKVSFKNLTIAESQLLLQYENTPEDNYIYYRHLIFLVSENPKFQGFAEDDFKNVDWKFVKEYVKIINQYNRENSFLLIRQGVLPTQ